MFLGDITEREKDLLLIHFFHYLPQSADAPAGHNNRGKIGREYPGIYNRLMGREIVKAEFPHERDKAIVSAFERGYTEGRDKEAEYWQAEDEWRYGSTL